MNVIQQSDSALQIEHFPVPWVIGLGAVQGVLVLGALKASFEGEWGGAGIALAMLAAIGWVWVTRIYRRLRISLDRPSGILRISAVTPLGEQASEYPLAELTRAEVQTRHDSNSSAEPCLVLVLGTGEGRRRLWPDPFKPDPADLLEVCARINDWMAMDRAAGDPTADKAEEVAS